MGCDVTNAEVGCASSSAGFDSCSNERDPAPLISIIILNYNGARWVDRCLDSIKKQTLYERLEVIVADNLSSDGSDKEFERILATWPSGRFIQNGANLGFCEGNNRPARVARGQYLFFLNNDTWMEPDCLEVLVKEVERMAAQAGTPLMLNYDDDSLQSAGGGGFDPFGLLSQGSDWSATRDIFVVGGCCYFIGRDLFELLGGFDAELFMYADEYDLSWRVWLSGARAVLVPAARLHHRGAAFVNPEGEQKVVEIRTSEMKRFYTNRNGLLLLLKNCQHVLLLLIPLQLMLLLAEALVAMVLIRRFSFIRVAFWGALRDCWRLRGHVRRERQRLARLRKRSDWWMLRFLSWRLNRMDELKRMRQLGLPKITTA
jgi:GT2 family glycosyltransferase